MPELGRCGCAHAPKRLRMRRTSSSFFSTMPGPAFDSSLMAMEARGEKRTATSEGNRAARAAPPTFCNGRVDRRPARQEHKTWQVLRTCCGPATCAVRSCCAAAVLVQWFPWSREMVGPGLVEATHKSRGRPTVGASIKRKCPSRATTPSTRQPAGRNCRRRLPEIHSTLPMAVRRLQSNRRPRARCIPSDTYFLFQFTVYVNSS